MRRIMMYLLALLAGLMPLAANAWWQQDWQYRKQISVDTTTQGGSINEAVGRVPLLIRLHTGNFTFDGVNANGSDLRFVAADDKTVLNYQIEDFDPLLGMAAVWVDVPQVEGAQRQDIWVYYGNEKAPAATNGQLAFDPNYTLVYHFNGAADAPPRDTTAYGNHAQTPVGGMVDGVIGHAAQFAGGAPLMLPASPSLAVPESGAFTFSAWVRADQPTGDQLVYARRDGASSLLIGLSAGVPFVEVNGQRTQPGQPLTPATWQHLAVTAGNGKVTLYVNGHPSATLAASLLAMSTAAAIGGDVPATDASAPASSYAPFVGAIDEVRLSKIERPAALILADATAQGSESRLVAYGADEKQSGFGFGKLGFLLKSVPSDAWIVIAVLIFMMLRSWFVMFTKGRQTKRVMQSNSDFREVFSKIGTRLEAMSGDTRLAAQLQDSPLWKLYSVALDELHLRRERGADTSSVSLATIEAIRASMDAARTKEAQSLNSRLGTLSNAIAGGPYIGLLGTVLGIMLVFLGTAMAGDVNINAVAPGMAAALLATAMGLVVAIPALYGYNHLTIRNKEIGADMRVFVDEFVTRLAEQNGVGQQAEAVAAK